MIHELARRFRRVSIWVAGDLMLDEYVMGSASRLSPEAPVPVLEVKSHRFFLGGAANVAANIASLGGTPVLTGLVGQDAAGERIRHLLGQAGISARGLVNSGDRCTISKTRIVADRHQLLRIDHEDRTPVSGMLLESALASASECMQDATVVVLSDYAKGLLNESFCARVIHEGRRHRLPVIVDPKTRDFRRYKGCTVITPNLLEASRASGIEIDSEDDLRKAGEYLLGVLPGSSVLITRGADGMTLFDERHEPVTVPAVAREVYDVTGAGDTVIAMLALAVGAGLPMPYAMQLANIAAGIVVDKPGTATATVEEVLAHDCTAGLLPEISAHVSSALAVVAAT